MKTSYRKTCAGNLLMWSDLTSGPSIKVKRRCLNLKVPISRLLLVLVVSPARSGDTMDSSSSSASSSASAEISC